MKFYPIQAVLAFLLFFSFASFAQVQFTELGSSSDWEKAKARAVEEDKLIFLDVYADWCMPCHRMDDEVFSNPQIGDYYNENFVNLKLDGETPFGEYLTKELAVEAFPTLFFLKGDGSILSNDAGYKEPSEFMEYGENSTALLTRLPELDKKYAQGNLTVDEKIEYATLLSSSGDEDKASEILIEYLNGLELLELATFKSWEIIKASVTEYENSIYKKVINNKDLFVKWRGDEEYTEFVGNVFTYGVISLSMMGTEAEMQSLMDATLPYLGGENNQAEINDLKLTAWQSFYEANGEWDKYARAIETYVKENNINDEYFFFERAKSAMQTDEPALRPYALKWAKKALDLQKDIQNMAIYAYALYENDRTPDALAVLDQMEEDFPDDFQAIDLAESLREEFTSGN